MNNQTVRKHYNARQDVGIAQRQYSPIFHLKNLNNFIKSILIKTHTQRNDHVLDLCAGKGGDLQKWNKQRIKYLLALDIADVSITQAKERYISSKFSFAADFHACDCFSDQVLNFTRRKTFDIVNCQFAIHYSFETELKARKTIEMISTHLVPGGHFIGTFPNSNWIVKKLMHSDELSFGNRIYNIRFESRDWKELFGWKYHFVLDDAIDDCPEFLVHIPTFIKICRDYGLDLVVMMPLHEFFERNAAKNLDLLERMKVFDADGNFPADDWEACGIYMTFVFKKRF